MRFKIIKSKPSSGWRYSFNNNDNTDSRRLLSGHFLFCFVVAFFFKFNFIKKICLYVFKNEAIACEQSFYFVTERKKINSIKRWTHQFYHFTWIALPFYEKLLRKWKILNSTCIFDMEQVLAFTYQKYYIFIGTF